MARQIDRCETIPVLEGKELKKEVGDFIQLLRSARTTLEKERPAPERDRDLGTLEETMRMVVRKCAGRIHPGDLRRIETEIFQVRQSRRRLSATQ